MVRRALELEGDPVPLRELQRPTERDALGDAVPGKAETVVADGDERAARQPRKRGLGGVRGAEEPRRL